MSNRFWLIQRGMFRNNETSTGLFGGSSGNLIDPEYMGSAEFEFGAIPKAYRRIMGQYEKYKLHKTDLVTVRGVPFYLFCDESKYETILDEIKRYINERYHLKEWTNIEAHFEENPASIQHHKWQCRTNFWWCIDISRTDEDLGDWMLFIGAADRVRKFNAALELDHEWWMSKTKAEREDEFKKSFRW